MPGHSTSTSSSNDDDDNNNGTSSALPQGNSMINRREMNNTIRSRNVEDDSDWLEEGKGKGKGKEQEQLAFLPPKESEREEPEKGGTLTVRDKRALVLLVVLCAFSLLPPPRNARTDAALSDLLQGIPVGLAFGSIPFLLRSKLSYSQIGIFTLCTYPYSLKLLWSPIVDSIFSVKLGRRKSWIVPIQLIVGGMMWWLGGNVSVLMEAVSARSECGGAGADEGVQAEPDVNTLTALFFVLVFFAATQGTFVKLCCVPGCPELTLRAQTSQ